MADPVPLGGLAALLSGGDRRSIGRAADAVERVLANPGLLAELIGGMDSDDPVLAMRCADVAEKVTRAHPDWLAPWRAALLGPLMANPQQEVRWHLAAMLPRLTLDATQAARVMQWLVDATQDRSSIVRASAMQGMADLSRTHPRHAAEARRHIEELTLVGSPAMRARGRRLLRQIP